MKRLTMCVGMLLLAGSAAFADGSGIPPTVPTVPTKPGKLVFMDGSGIPPTDQGPSVPTLPPPPPPPTLA